jgi:hypothetical protein
MSSNPGGRKKLRDLSGIPKTGRGMPSRPEMHSTSSEVTDLLTRFDGLVQAGAKFEPTFEQVAASLGKSLGETYTKETFRKEIEEGDREKAKKIMVKWAELIKQKKEAAGPKLLPSHQQLAPTLGLPKVAPFPSEELNKRLTGLKAAADKVRVGLGQVVSLKEATLLDLINSDNATVRGEASRIMEEWTKAVRRKAEEIKRLRGITPKSSPPPKEGKLNPDSEWEVIGLDQAGRDTILQAHNRWRHKYRMPLLEYDLRLEDFALDWASNLAQKWPDKDKYSKHRKEVTGITTRVDPFPGETGENIEPNAVFQVYDAKMPTWKIDHNTPVDDWGSEEEYYDHQLKKPKPNLASHQDPGHFTQMIWKATTKVGCGFVMFAIRHRNGRLVTIHAWWVCNYYCAGNFKDIQFTYGPDIYSQYKFNT